MASHASDSKRFIEKGPRARVINACRRFRHQIVAIPGRRCGEIGAYRRSCCVNATLTSPWKGLKYGFKKSARDARRSTFNNHAVPRLKKQSSANRMEGTMARSDFGSLPRQNP